MKYCSHCGGALEEGSRFCNHCGAPVSEFTAASAGGAAVQAAPVPEAPEMPDPVWKPEGEQTASGSYSASASYSAPSADEPAEDLKRINVLDYVGPFFLVAIFLKKNDPFSRFHINQGCVLFILELICFNLLGGGIFGVAAFLFELYCVVFGAKNVAAGKMARLPLIGKFQILKK